MPEYTTAQEMVEFANRADVQKAITESKAEPRNTFLSHSSKDNKLVPGALVILEIHGGRVYVDLGDARLPKEPSTETAEILRDSVKRLRRFVLLVSKNSKDSIWIPWELGLADGQKGVGSIALFPAVEFTWEKSWTEQEYLGLYPRIVYGSIKGYEKQLWMVYNHHLNTATPLSDWLLGL